MAGIANRAGSRIPEKTAEEYIRASIISHDEFIVEGFDEGVMLSIVGDDFGNILPPEDIDSLVAYLMTLDSHVAEQEPASESSTQSATATDAITQTRNTSATLTASASITPGLELAEDDQGLLVVDETSFAFQPVVGWQAGSFATRRIIIRPEDANPRQGPVIAMGYGTLEDLNIPNEKTEELTAREAFNQVMGEYVRSEFFALTVEMTRELKVDGYPVQVLDIGGWGFGDIEEPFAGQLAFALIDEHEVFFMLGLATPPAKWDADDTFEEMLTSLTFSPDAATGSAIPPASDDAAIAMHSPHAFNIMAKAAVPQTPGEGDGLRCDGTHNPPGRVSSSSPCVFAAEEAEAAEEEADRDKGPRFACVQCHVSHEVEMLHDSNPSCNTCHQGTPFQRHCVDCHSIHGVNIPHEINNPDCASCHPAGLPGEGTNMQHTLLTFLAYVFHEI
jgi:hypothetical protein